MQAVKKTVCYGVLLLMSCFTCLVLFGSGLITEAYGANDSYTPLTTYANFSLTKTIAGREFQEGDSFTFAIEPQDGAPDPDPGSISINPSSDHKYEYKEKSRIIPPFQLLYKIIPFRQIKPICNRSCKMSSYFNLE